MAKKTVEFGEFVGWYDHPAGAIQARLCAVRGHYRLGDEPLVLTSAVIRIEYDDDRSPREIETLNTIYVRANSVPVESLGREHADGAA